MQLLEKIKHWVIAFWNALLHMGDFFYSLPEFKEAPIEIAMDRLKRCNGCPSLDVMTRQCQKCFCFVGLKVRDANQSCPLGKWEVYDDRLE